MTEQATRPGKVKGADWRDAYLCFCKEITADDFRDKILAEPDRSFEEVCADTGLATKCTACLLNAENLFIEVKREGTTGGGVKSRGREKSAEGWSRQRLYKVLDEVSPTVPRTIPGIIPIIAGKDVKTILAFSNSIPPLIGSRSPAFDVTVETRGPDGHVIARKAGRVEPGGRLEFEISEGLLPEHDTGGSSLQTGACFLTYKAASRGYIGSIRPHFSVVTPIASTAVHSAGAGRESAFHETCYANSDETQYVSAINCTDAPANVSPALLFEGRRLELDAVTIPPRGAVLIEIPRDRTPAGRPFGVLAQADAEVRWHYLVKCGEPPRISLDHI